MECLLIYPLDRRSPMANNGVICRFKERKFRGARGFRKHSQVKHCQIIRITNQYISSGPILGMVQLQTPCLDVSWTRHVIWCTLSISIVRFWCWSRGSRHAGLDVAWLHLIQLNKEKGKRMTEWGTEDVARRLRKGWFRKWANNKTWPLEGFVLPWGAVIIVVVGRVTEQLVGWWLTADQSVSPSLESITRRHASLASCPHPRLIGWTSPSSFDGQRFHRRILPTCDGDLHGL